MFRSLSLLRFTAYLFSLDIVPVGPCLCFLSIIRLGFMKVVFWGVGGMVGVVLGGASPFVLCQGFKDNLSNII